METGRSRGRSRGRRQEAGTGGSGTLGAEQTGPTCPSGFARGRLRPLSVLARPLPVRERESDFLVPGALLSLWPRPAGTAPGAPGDASQDSRVRTAGKEGAPTPQPLPRGPRARRPPAAPAAPLPRATWHRSAAPWARVAAGLTEGLSGSFRVSQGQLLKTQSSDVLAIQNSHKAKGGQFRKAEEPFTRTGFGVSGRRRGVSLSTDTPRTQQGEADTWGSTSRLDNGARSRSLKFLNQRCSAKSNR